VTKWEYLVESVPVDNAKEVTARFNGLGEQGWEIVSCFPDPTDPRWLLVFLKRLKAT